jgi:hypothetical protein
MDNNALTRERTMANSSAAGDRISVSDAAIRAIEGPFRRLGWYLRISGIVERTFVFILAAVLLVGAVGSLVWLATSRVVAP